MARGSTTTPKRAPRARRRSTSTPSSGSPLRVLFVCLGNICRSPTAEGVMRRLLADEGLQDSVSVQSAGTGSWHVGHPPDARSTEAARGRGIILEGAARQVTAGDFDEYDLLVAMDRSNQRDLLALAPDAAAREKVVLLRSYDPEAEAAGELDVPDPYYGAGDGFEHVLDVVDRAARGLLERVRP